MALIYKAAAGFHWGGVTYSEGDEIDTTGWSPRQIEQLQIHNPVYLPSSGGSLPEPTVETAGFVVTANTAGDALELTPVSAAPVPGADIRGVDITHNGNGVAGSRLPANLAVAALHQYTNATLSSPAGGTFGLSFPATLDTSAALLQAISLTVYKMAGADGVPLATPYPMWLREYYDEFDNPFSVQTFLTAGFLEGSGDAGFTDVSGAISTDALGLYLVVAHARWAA